MWFFVIAGAAVVDAFATGMWLGKKWGTSAVGTASLSSVATAVGADAATLKTKVVTAATGVKSFTETVEGDVSKVVSALEADVAALRAKVSPPPVVSPTPADPAKPVVPIDPVAAAVMAQAASAPK